MKIFITGGSGLIGQYLNLELAKSHEILTVYNKHEGNCKEFNFSHLDITDYGKLKEVFMTFKPDIVVHSAAVSSPAMADKLLPARVEEINVTATKKLAELCHQTKAKMIYISTDLVYDGGSSGFLNERAKLHPLSLYAKSKLAGENAIRNTFFNYVILRLALTYGFGLNHSVNHFADTIYKLKKGKPVKLFTDQYRTPVCLNDSARMISELIEKGVKGEVINFGGNERLSRYDLICAAAEKFDLDRSLLKKNKMDDAGIKYKVKDVSLNTDRLKSYGIIPRNLKESLNMVAASFNR